MESIHSLWKEWEVEGASILVVDDEEDYALLTAGSLRRAGAGRVWTATTVEEAERLYVVERPELAVIDYHMPPRTGMDVIAALRAVQRFPEELAIVMQTGSRSSAIRHKALAHMVTDFVLKEYDPTELLLRVGKALRLHRLELHRLSENARLEAVVEERTEQLQRANREIFDRLAKAAAMRDEDTAEHTSRVGRIAHEIARALGLDAEVAEQIGRAAELHDLGKIGIPDEILRKPGRLTPEERATMETHAALGAALLEGCESAALRCAKTIARSHHEHWDGRGYPDGLTGERIPLEGRIVAVADAYDAMTKDRPYRKAMPLERARAILDEGSGTQWDPRVVDAFAASAAHA